MKSNYKKLGQFIRVVEIRNKEDRKDNLLGVSTRKVFINSVANTVGTDYKKYKIVKKKQFTYVPDTSRRGDKMGIAMLENYEQALVSQAYTVFEVTDAEKLNPEYLMMWFRRPEFDRYARFKSHGSVREIFDWEEMCDIELPVVSIEKQCEIVREYNVVNDRISLNEQLIQKLEDTTQTIYKQWFVDFEFPISKKYAELIGKPELEGKPYQSSGGDMEFSEELERDIPIKWKPDTLESVLNVKHGFAFKGEYFTKQDCGNVLLTPGNIKIGGGVKLNKMRFYDGDLPKDYAFNVGDIMVTMTDLSKVSDTLGYPARIPAIKGYKLLHNQRLGKIEFKNDFVFKEFIYQLLCSTEYRNEIVGGATGTTVKHTSPTKIMNFKFARCFNPSIYKKFCQVIKPIEDHKESLSVEKIELKKILSILLTKISNLV